MVVQVEGVGGGVICVDLTDEPVVTSPARKTGEMKRSPQGKKRRRREGQPHSAEQVIDLTVAHDPPSTPLRPFMDDSLSSPNVDKVAGRVGFSSTGQGRPTAKAEEEDYIFGSSRGEGANRPGQRIEDLCNSLSKTGKESFVSCGAAASDTGGLSWISKSTTTSGEGSSSRGVGKELMGAIAVPKREIVSFPPGSCRGCGALAGQASTLIRAHCNCLTCTPCLRMAVGLPAGDGSAGGGSVTGCPECGEMWCESDMLQCMSREEVDGVMHRLTLAFLDSNPEVVQCPKPGCGTRIMRNPELPDNAHIDRVAPDGQQLTLRQARHMSSHRLRCPDCATNFCAKCRTVPYHVALTCEQEKERQEARPCRFCSAPLRPGAKAGSTCGSADCKKALRMACEVRHKNCKHWCIGVEMEAECPPCLECSGDADEFCNICWTDALRASPVIQLKCKHIFHLACVRKRLEKKWPTPKISFKFATCPLCSAWVDHPTVSALVKDVKKLMKTVQDAAVQRIKLEGGDKDVAALAKHKGSLVDLALSKYNYYLCQKCKRPYFGGAAACDDAAGAGGDDAQGEGGRAEELMCGKCSGAALGMHELNCKQHGDQYIEFKCRYCCHIATFFCFGHTHFCDGCHKKWVVGAYKAPHTLVQPCRCKHKHPPNGTTQASEACFGCSLCRIKSADAAPL